MSILCDAEIRDRCIPPSLIFDHELFDRKKKEQHIKGWPLGTAAVRTLLSQFREECTRPLTEEELTAFKPMISPFEPHLLREAAILYDHGPVGDGTPDHHYTMGPRRRIISKGLTSYGYDVSLAARDIKLFTNINSTIIDPKRLDLRCLVDAKIHTDVDGALYCILPPNSYMLAHTAEYFYIPRDILIVCVGKSTYARAGIGINVTPIEPEWHGNVVIEITNGTSLPAKIYLEEGISQFLFLQGSRPCETSYADRAGKYLGQTGTTHAKV